jgi:peptide deformylase
MILPVEIYGSPILRKVSQNIEKDYDNLDLLIANMHETMYNAEGVGLAAPQIGKNIRLLVIDASPMKEDDPSLEFFKKVIINPTIIEESGEVWSFNEGCLSLPEIREDVKRKSNILIEYYDEHFNYHKESYSGIQARVLQHEYDHLQGILFIDRIAPLRKKLIKRKLNDILKHKINTFYKTRSSKLTQHS